ncbi:MAG: Rrf2 family transcriptional regulator [Chrysiogenetes bacterium]|nr:Rrf2 family transcriptional regulator [Chrysiogenetes bacterium]
MLKFSRKTDYGLIALRHMAHKGESEVSSAREIADQYGISYELVSKILQKLKKHKLIDSVQGVAGGYRISRKPDEVTLFNFLETLEGPLGMIECAREDEGQPCAVTGCNIMTPMQELNRKIMRVLQETTLADLFRTSGAPVQLAQIERLEEEQRAVAAK